MPPTAEAKREIIAFAGAGDSYSKIAEAYGLTRNQVAGIVWRAKHPGMWTLRIPGGQKRHYSPCRSISASPSPSA